MCKLILTINCQNNQLLTYLFSLSEILTFNEPPGNMVYVKKKKSDRRRDLDKDAVVGGDDTRPGPRLLVAVGDEEPQLQSGPRCEYGHRQMVGSWGRLWTLPCPPRKPSNQRKGHVVIISSRF